MVDKNIKINTQTDIYLIAKDLLHFKLSERENISKMIE